MNEATDLRNMPSSPNGVYVHSLDKEEGVFSYIPMFLDLGIFLWIL